MAFATQELVGRVVVHAAADQSEDRLDEAAPAAAPLLMVGDDLGEVPAHAVLVDAQEERGIDARGLHRLADEGGRAERDERAQPAGGLDADESDDRGCSDLARARSGGTPGTSVSPSTMMTSRSA